MRDKNEAVSVVNSASCICCADSSSVAVKEEFLRLDGKFLEELHMQELIAVSR